MPGSRRGLAEWERDCRVRARYRALIVERLAAEGWGFFLTLTSKEVIRDRHGFLSLVRRELLSWFRGRRWMCCVERGDRLGRWHAHALLDGSVPLRAVERFCRWWGVDNREGLLRGQAFVDALNIGIARVDIVRRTLGDEERVAAYCVKYLLKQDDALWACKLSRHLLQSDPSTQVDCWLRQDARGYEGAVASTQLDSATRRAQVSLS